METVKISPKFQVVIPAKVRKSLNLKAGQRVRMIPIDGKIEVVPVPEAKSLRGFAKGIDASLEREEDRF
ncbi:MAG: AbrB/MazE/SpoVT family DNA-binding domain-containing protein [Gracilimonas sp.]|jgi:AbrB family looped-hinge helix DNA binding protein|uniref:AbrB/MazE/SpoVT family DNA-binding domain-containing protein n=1 Tax=Gracilimonas sp. TaxID=1974203 RepID=UPI003750A961|nr:AbrB/MazE/SpoVT family DNA-binding domain-containing protein [Gracilimonas sp.]